MSHRLPDQFPAAHLTQLFPSLERSPSSGQFDSGLCHHAGGTCAGAFGHTMHMTTQDSKTQSRCRHQYLSQSPLRAGEPVDHAPYSRAAHLHYLPAHCGQRPLVLDFGRQGPEVQILSPRPIKTKSYGRIIRINLKLKVCCSTPSGTNSLCTIRSPDPDLALLHSETCG